VCGYEFPLFYDFHKGVCSDDRSCYTLAAYRTAKKINMPEFHWKHLMTAAACAMLSRQKEAHAVIECLNKCNPAFLDLQNVRDDIELWDPDKNQVEKSMLGLQKAGLKYVSADSTIEA
jgi:hypothetical protein